MTEKERDYIRALVSENQTEGVINWIENKIRLLEQELRLSEYSLGEF